MREINHKARLKGVNKKFEPRQSETFVRGQTKVFKKAESVSPPPTSLFCARLISRAARNRKVAFRSLETLATQAMPTVKFR